MRISYFGVMSLRILTFETSSITGFSMFPPPINLSSPYIPGLTLDLAATTVPKPMTTGAMILQWPPMKVYLVGAPSQTRNGDSIEPTTVEGLINAPTVGPKGRKLKLIVPDPTSAPTSRAGLVPPSINTLQKLIKEPRVILYPSTVVLVSQLWALFEPSSQALCPRTLAHPTVEHPSRRTESAYSPAARLQFLPIRLFLIVAAPWISVPAPIIVSSPRIFVPGPTTTPASKFSGLTSSPTMTDSGARIFTPFAVSFSRLALFAATRLSAISPPYQVLPPPQSSLIKGEEQPCLIDARILR